MSAERVHSERWPPHGPLGCVGESVWVGEPKRQAGVWCTVGLEQVEFIRFFGSVIEITPEHCPVVLDFIFIKWTLLINSVFKSPREGGMEGWCQNSGNYYLSCTLYVTWELILSIPRDSFLTSEYRPVGWLVTCAHRMCWKPWRAISKHRFSRGFKYFFLSPSLSVCLNIAQLRWKHIQANLFNDEKQGPFTLSARADCRTMLALC